MHVFEVLEKWAVLQDKGRTYCRKLSALLSIKGQRISLWLSHIKPNHLQRDDTIFKGT